MRYISILAILLSALSGSALAQSAVQDQVKSYIQNRHPYLNGSQHDIMADEYMRASQIVVNMHQNGTDANGLV